SIIGLPQGAFAAPDAVDVSRTHVSMSLGSRLAFTSTIRNTSDRPLTGLVAHLNVLSLDPTVYIDPEDWSSHRTQYLTPLMAGKARPLEWSVQAVSKGRIILYVTVAAEHGSDHVDVSSALRVDVRPRRTIDAAGVLPVAIAVPAAALGLCALSVGYR